MNIIHILEFRFCGFLSWLGWALSVTEVFCTVVKKVDGLGRVVVDDGKVDDGMVEDGVVDGGSGCAILPKTAIGLRTVANVIKLNWLS